MQGTQGGRKKRHQKGRDDFMLTGKPRDGNQKPAEKKGKVYYLGIGVHRKGVTAGGGNNSAIVLG